MNEIQKKQITKLRQDGYGYGKIDILLDVSENTVKSFCRRNGLVNIVIKEKEVKVEDTNVIDSSYCVNCGEVVIQVEGIKTKKFYSDECRKKYWSKNQFKINRKSATEYTCSVCGKKYIDYARNNRKYCSRECYIVYRKEVRTFTQ